MAQLLGHNSSKTTEIYTHVSTKSPFMICSKKLYQANYLHDICVYLLHI